MRLNIIRVIIFVFFFVFVFSAKAYAAAPVVDGYVLTPSGQPVYYNDPALGPVGLWIKWSDNAGNVRYIQADTNGHFVFPSWQITDRDTQLLNWIDTNFDGTNDSPQAFHPGTGGYSGLDTGFGCGENPHTFTASRPAAWSGSFTTVTPVNFPNGAYNVSLPTWVLDSANNGGTALTDGNIRYRASLGTIEGYKIIMPNNQSIAPAAGQTVTLDGAITKTSNPYFFTSIDLKIRAGTHTVSVPNISGYTAGYTLCYNKIDCHTDPAQIIPGNSVVISNSDMLTLNYTSGQPYYADLYWHYTPNAPSLGAMTIREGLGATPGATGKSGLRADDPNLTANRGGNSNNPIEIRVTVTNGSNTNVNLVGTVFGSSTKPNSLSQAITNVSAVNGFVAVYAQCGGSATCTVAGVPGQTFTRGYFYVYFKNSGGGWQWNGPYDPNDDNPRLSNFINYSYGLTVKMVGTVLSPLSTVTFNVGLYQPLGSRTWGTYGYLMDNQNTESTLQGP